MFVVIALGAITFASWKALKATREAERLRRLVVRSAGVEESPLTGSWTVRLLIPLMLVPAMRTFDVPEPMQLWSSIGIAFLMWWLVVDWRDRIPYAVGAASLIATFWLRRDLGDSARVALMSSVGIYGLFNKWASVRAAAAQQRHVERPTTAYFHFNIEPLREIEHDLKVALGERLDADAVTKILAWLAQVRYGERRLKEALNVLNAAQQAAPACPDPHAVRAAIYCLEERYQEAVTASEVATALAPGWSLGRAIASLAEAGAGLAERSRESAREAGKGSTTPAEAAPVHFYLALAARKRGEEAVALEISRSIPVMAPGDMYQIYADRVHGGLEAFEPS
jgi:tetratricopeptide (TPR) repeat protein